MERSWKTVAELLGGRRGVVHSIPAGATVHAALERLAEHDVGVLVLLKGERPPSSSKTGPMPSGPGCCGQEDCHGSPCRPDLPLEQTSVCVADGNGRTLWQGKCASNPEALAVTIRATAPAAVRVGLESSTLSGWQGSSWMRARHGTRGTSSPHV